MKQVLDSIVAIIAIASIMIIYMLSNNDGIKSIHDKVAIIMPKKEIVDEPVEETKNPPMYVIQPIKSI